MTNLNRRELLQRVAYLMGGALSSSAIAGVLSGCAAHANEQWKPLLFTQPQADLVSAIAEIIIPRTDTPGAKEVGVPAFIDLILKDAYRKAERERFFAGLKDFEALSLRQHRQSFLSLTPEQQQGLVQRVHDDAVDIERKRAARTGPPQRPFILMMKELTLLGFFTSQVGATQVLQHESIPGRYQACVPLKEAGNGKAWAMEANLPF